MTALSLSLNVEEKARLTAGLGMWSTHPIPGTQIGSVTLSDGPMGITGGRVDERDVALLSPCGLALGASWDSDLVSRVGEVIGQEAQRTGVQAVLAPNLNLMRSPLAGRAFELFGEDPRHIATLGAAWLAGVQRQGVGCVVKHLVCNDSETDRRGMNVEVDEATLREVYFWPFEVTARRGAWGMLTAYNRVNGTYCAQHQQAISGWLKQELAWDGLVMSDWFGTQNGLASFHAGLDLEMPGPARHMGEKLLPTLTGSQEEAERLDDAAARLARFAERVSHSPRYDASAAAQRQRLNTLEEAAAAGFVLLKNAGGTLPLRPQKGQRVAVIGPNATAPCFQGGTFARVALMPGLVSPLEALRARFAAEGVSVSYAQGVESDYRIPPLHALPLRAADDRPGLDVTFLNARGETLAHEVRNASSLIWFRDMPGVGDMLGLEDRAEIVVRSRFVAPADGRYRFWIGGTGAVTLSINDSPAATFNGEALEGDIMGKLMQAPSNEVTLPLQAGETVSFAATMSIGKSIAHGIWFGCQPPQPLDLLQQALEQAREADSVVLVIGETSDAGLESVDRDATALPAHQVALIRAVCAENPRTTVVLNVAHPVDTDCLRDAAAIVVAWYPGQEFGPALAAVIAGDREPGGRLPVTFAHRLEDYSVRNLTPDTNGNLYYRERQQVGWRGFAAKGTAPAWALGSGMGYAEIALSQATLVGEDAQNLRVNCCLENRSSRDGKAVVQLYLSGPGNDGAILAAFAACTVSASGRQPLSIALPADAMRRWQATNHCWATVYGDYQLRVGFASDNIIATLDFTLQPDGQVVQRA
ncbi:glycoside hydrolase family 3 C-terminal domain-containing protein [Pluralibacter gergoviae]|uniref:glycoside hydrolase family 3 protein n=1 Tax=Pluralibacter gergoviae TaxID=61647 RepID=UPI0008DBEC2A|nr:glycoside hydrolase family 3 C-terminal domain-containing protein [Pluralibacter gergoviae]EKW6619383.1 glycoside hydrolase family 3 C-terminal domain-containing protein [Pluralibacter gergoviae]OHY70218.1 beta-glucosidase [Pluralibacter gergoviae]